MQKKRLAIEAIEAQSVPTKILIPLIEKSSQEDLNDDVMIERWANLLASAAKDNSTHPRLVQVLSEMQKSQVKFMELLALNKKDDWDYPAREFGDSFINMDSWAVETFMQEYRSIKYKSEEDALNGLVSYFDRPGSLSISAGIEDYILEHEYDSNASFDTDIYSSLGLVQNRALNVRATVSGRKVNGFASFCNLTSLGIKLIETCSPDTIKQLNQSN